MQKEKVKIILPNGHEASDVNTTAKDNCITVEYSSIEKKKFIPKDGDIVFAKILGYDWIFIFRKEDKKKIYNYCAFCISTSDFYIEHRENGDYLCDENQIKEIRLATKEEQDTLFKSLERRQCRWNKDKKKVEDLEEIRLESIISTFKDGDMIHVEYSFGTEIRIFRMLVDGCMFTYKLYSNDSPYDELQDILDVRKVTEQERQKAKTYLRLHHTYWNTETKELEDFYHPKNGDIISLDLISGTKWIVIFNQEHEDKIYDYFNFDTITQNYFANPVTEPLKIPLCNNSDVERIQLATEKEKHLLFDFLKSKDLEWNADTKQLTELYTPKEGDIIYTDTGGCNWVSIFNKICDGKLYTYCDFCIGADFLCISDPKNSFFPQNKITKLRRATKEERRKLFIKLSEDKIEWNVKERRFEPVPEDGDILVLRTKAHEDDYLDWIVIYKGTDKDKIHVYCSFCTSKNSTINNWEKPEYFAEKKDVKFLHLASSKEKQALFDKLKEYNFQWNSEKKRIERISEKSRWRAKINQPYYSITTNDGHLIPAFNIDYRTDADNYNYFYGYYFKSVTDAQNEIDNLKNHLKIDRI